MPEITAVGWALLAFGALVVGLSKTAIPGAGTVAVALFAAVLPARSSTATLLLLLILGDVLALSMYRRHADWRALLRLAPAVVLGMVVGALFLLFADDGAVRRVIGGILLALLALTVWLRRRPAPRPAPTRAPDDEHRAAPAGRLAAAGYGSLGGFTTMVANAGGPVMSLYFLAARFDAKAFLGTAAWFFAIVNVAKLPFMIGSGLLTVDALLLDLLLVPAVLVGALVGRLVVARMTQSLFELIVMGLTAVTAVYLIVA
ncbi:sulfite exporter TauE/SafE family protein [Microbacterium telephonicum]|uniref:Probable membrane transporter protein n=1 Tax=Microbacterium telephonicum TaxID=1714841 RepID=A0A498CBY5_9MICO|nr:sulfite exporter TauE/SafE family protein [Microbacterium telephonicum]RLK52609.1 hypothetical protein C7474_0560 [Microbacterium telephonicum]